MSTGVAGSLRRRAGIPWLTVFALALAAASVVAMTHGAVETSASEVLSVLARRLLGLELGPAVDRQLDAVVWNLRLPRVLLGGLVGAALALSGAALQGMFRNPLADPGLVGVSSGAALGAMLAIYLGRERFELLLPIPEHAMVAAAAFGGGLLATALVYRLASHDGRTSVTTMLLAGIAINAFAGAGMGTLTYLAEDAQLRDLVMWTLGSLGGASWEAVAACAVALGVCGAVLLRSAGLLDALLLGSGQAHALGVDVARLERTIVVCVACMVGAALAFSGLIGFVGLVAPHIVRLLLGPGHVRLLPASVLLGALLLVVADLVARTALAPAELPIGIVTALVGGPFFLALLVRSRGEGE